MEKRVVITGMGIWSCIGTTLDEVRDSLYNGKSGIVFNAERKSLGFRSALCTDVPKPDLKPFIPRNQRQFMPGGPVCLYRHETSVRECKAGCRLHGASRGRPDIWQRLCR